MPFCSKCGADAGAGRFCPKCGAPMEAAEGGESAPAGGFSPSGSGAGSPPGAQADGGLSDNVAGALAYFTIIPAILFLVIDPFKTRRFVRFHSFQCLFLAAAAFAFWIIFGVLATALSFMGGGMLIGMVSFLVQIGIIVVWFIAVIKAYQGQEFRLPVIGDLAAKQV